MIMKILNKIALSVALLGATSIANAGMITQWNYINEAGFTAAEPNAVTKSGFVSAGSSILTQDTWKKLSWGQALSPAGKSSLTVDSPVTGSINTVNVGQSLIDSDFQQGTNLTHNNYNLGGPRSEALTGATLLDGLKLSAANWDVPFDLSGIEGLAPELTIKFDFLETPNRPAGKCVDGSTPGTDVNDVDPNEKFGCDDYFILDPLSGLNVTLNDRGDLDPTNDFVEFTTSFDLIDLGFPKAIAQSLQLVTKYEVVTRLTGLTVTTVFCGNQAAPCLGFATEELKQNVLFASFAVRAVPAPAGLAFLGLALLGLGINARRKKA
jgi:hypothetical protein